MVLEILKRAVCEGDLKTIFEKTRNGKYITQKRCNGNTLLHLAALCGNYEVSLVLLKKFVDKILQLEDEGKILKRLKRLLQNKEGKTPLHLAAENGNLEFIKALKEFSAKGGKLNLFRIFQETRDQFGNLPVHLAASNGKIEVLKEFPEEVNSKNGEGNTPLHKAVEKRQKEAVEFLLSAGADTEVENNYGLTPKQLAKFLNYRDILETFENFNKSENSPANSKDQSKARVFAGFIEEYGNDFEKPYNTSALGKVQKSLHANKPKTGKDKTGKLYHPCFEGLEFCVVK